MKKKNQDWSKNQKKMVLQHVEAIKSYTAPPKTAGILKLMEETEKSHL